ncbi:hypothetical protein [Mucilaginibacter gilvus]|uniref:Uncharacterized protein n=1 Tax=Mucilaginibacter gilvus TaxID=2305909 RepID=A0A3S3V8U7_9SPHI|nr:hypothetical protein [Mucilaginibacter gilvus]RWY48158.1 hypothetical protein EPL05_21520 [Mucilaginibacter gilvus]
MKTISFSRVHESAVKAFRCGVYLFVIALFFNAAGAYGQYQNAFKTSLGINDGLSHSNVKFIYKATASPAASRRIRA